MWQFWQHQVVAKDVVHAMSVAAVAAVVVIVIAIGAFSMV